MQFYSWTIQDLFGSSLMMGAVAESEGEARKKIAERLDSEFDYLCLDILASPEPCDVATPISDLVIIVPDEDYSPDNWEDVWEFNKNE